MMGVKKKMNKKDFEKDIQELLDKYVSTQNLKYLSMISALTECEINYKNVKEDIKKSKEK